MESLDSINNIVRLLRISKESFGVAVFFLTIVVILFPLQSLESLYVLVPLIIALWLCSYCIIIVWKKDREVPVLDIGVLCVLFTTLYTIIPLLNFYLGGLEFGVLSDGRLQHANPSAQDIGLFFQNHLIYLASLVFAYVFFRKTNRLLPRFQTAPPSATTLKILVVFFVVFTIYYVALFHLFGIGFKSGYGDESHILEGPLWLQQINGKLDGIRSLFQTAVVAFLVYKKDDIRAKCLLLLMIVWIVFDTFYNPGSRGEVMRMLLLTFLFWHRWHGVSLKAIFVAPIVLITLFSFLGLYRSFGSVGDLVLALDAFKTVASATNEFQAMLATGMDVNNMMLDSVSIPFILYFNDLTPMLPPQQLLPIDKLSAADWYVIQIGHEGTGVGFMWSVISQSLIGFGMQELVIRGLILGWFLAFLHCWYQRRYTRFLPTVIYVIMCLNTLWTFRDTTGSILWLIWWSVIPFVLIFYMLGIRSEFKKVSFSAFRNHHCSRMAAT